MINNYPFRILLFTLLTTLLFSNTVLAQKKIRWFDNKPLKWSNFKGNVDGSSKYAALTASGIYYSYETTKDGELIFTIESHFDPKNSWVKKEKKNDKLLEHEQRHFDITELYARKLKKEISEREFSYSKSLQKKLNKLYQNWVGRLNTEQKSYDKETKHHLNQEGQKKWNKRINAELDKLKDYTHSRIVKKLSY